jgi:hypothetical protein
MTSAATDDGAMTVANRESRIRRQSPVARSSSPSKSRYAAGNGAK